MKRCRACGAHLSWTRTWPGGNFQWVDTGAQVCGAFCPEADGEAHQPAQKLQRAVIKISLPFEGNVLDSPEIREALDNLASVMHVQAEDGLYTDGGGRHGDGEHLADFAGGQEVSVHIVDAH